MKLDRILAIADDHRDDRGPHQHQDHEVRELREEDPPGVPVLRRLERVRSIGREATRRLGRVQSMRRMRAERLHDGLGGSRMPRGRRRLHA